MERKSLAVQDLIASNGIKMTKVKHRNSEKATELEGEPGLRVCKLSTDQLISVPTEPILLSQDTWNGPRLQDSVRVQAPSSAAAIGIADWLCCTEQ